MFLVVVLPPALALVWLGLRLLEQDHVLQTQREIEGREAAAEGIVRALAQSLADLESRLAVGALPEGALRIVVSGVGVRSEPAQRLLWTDKALELPEAVTAAFVDAERAEYQGRHDAALRVYRELSRLSDESVRAGALLRLARVARKEVQIDEALGAYRELAGLHGLAIDGTPVNLLARRALCALLRDSGHETEFRQEVNALSADLLASRWTLDRARWELAASEIESWTGRPPVSGEIRAVTMAAEWIWQRVRDSNLPPSGHRSMVVDSVPLTLLWRTETPANPSPRWEAIVAAHAVIATALEKAQQTAARKAGRVTLLTESGELFSGRVPDVSGGVVRRAASDTNLPWAVVLSATDESREAASLDTRRRLVGSGLAAIVLLLAGGSYFLWRVIARELAVARLQTDFVAAVSHEFRTPLTSLRHITELLEEDDGAHGAGQEQRKSFYAALGRNTERLHRLVESLLDFSRMETGRKPWRREAMDAGELAARVIAEFEKEFEARGVRIDLVVESPGELLLQADADALGHALWNLLDNAVKYSPGSNVVQVRVRRSAQGVVIAVQDEGLGIPARERRQIFDKFVRGQKTSELGIKGTGLGLAIVSHIVAAHGGAVELESEEGKGSTFRLVLPA